MGIILDTTVLVAAERGRFDLTALTRTYGEENFSIAAITASELLHGYERSTNPEMKEKRRISVEDILARI